MPNRLSTAWQDFWGPARPGRESYARRALVLATGTHLWSYMALDLLSRLLAGRSRIADDLFFLLHGAWGVQVAFLFLLYLLILALYVPWVPRITAAPRTWLHRLSDLRGLSTPLLILTGLGFAVMLLSYDRRRLPPALAFLLTESILTWLYGAVPPERGLRGLAQQLMREFQLFASGVPLLRRFVPEPGDEAIERLSD